MSNTDNLASLSPLQVEELLVGHWNREAKDDYWFPSFAYSEWLTEEGTEQVEGLGSVEVVEYIGGRVCGDDTLLVFRVANGEGDVVRHFGVDGVYCVASGVSWEGDLYEVAPKEVLVTKYDRL